jgi:RNA polymerase sigma factor (sigma-70 family)
MPIQADATEFANGNENPGQAPGHETPTLRDLLPGALAKLEAYVRKRLARTIRDRESAVDLVQSICGHLLAAGVPFEYRGESQFHAWLQVVVANEIRGRLRKYRDDRPLGPQVALATGSELEAARAMRPNSATPPAIALQNEEIGLLDAALAQLPDHYREVIVRRHLREHSRARIARDLGLTIAAVQNLLARAKAKLAGILDRSPVGPDRVLRR